MPNRHMQEVIDNQKKLVEIASQNCTLKYGSRISDGFFGPYYNETSQELNCFPLWDGISCWPYTPAGNLAILPCPAYISGFKTDKFATRNCTENGTWYTNKSTNAPWANYTACMDGKFTTIFTLNPKSNISHASENIFPTIKVISQIGYAVSLLSLIIAFLIMLLIRKLHCARNILHMNLFASFILRGFFYIIKDLLFVGGTALSEDLLMKDGELFFKIDFQTNNFACKLLATLVQFFTTANHSWILMEGIYLNNLVFRAPFADSSRNLIYYIIFGWGLPLLVIIPWTVTRIYIDDTLCWTTNDNIYAYMILVIPTIISVIINFILFIIISIVLFTKLSSPIISERSRRYKKWAKSTLVLVPLFGAHYAVLLLFYFVGQTEIWLVCDTLFGSFQGFFVAVLYCFLNGEVKTELKPYVLNFLRYLAKHRILRACFPCRERFLRSAVGRQSVCTTMSFSSVYTNGLGHRSKSKGEGCHKEKNVGQIEKNVEQSVNDEKPLRLGYLNQSNKIPTISPEQMETSFSEAYDHGQRNRNLSVTEEEVCMLGNKL